MAREDGERLGGPLEGAGGDEDSGYVKEVEEALALVDTLIMPILLRNLLLTWLLERMIFGFKMGEVVVVEVTMEPDEDEEEEDVVDMLEEDLL
eukprot:CAMPEP_0171339992 /NCGR_PEP_ID=MMETSP0878-20121228/8282_1 /TAXON_ID=67004 /ORGANISM="Thalassiosira weissflogii, Strain CCMP1336" /LENGTH=92 /DNA_ID=CAMNT_0011841985 /DNA_START=158 /DNA_END=435 /DNA_ORIENTATION=-